MDLNPQGRIESNSANHAAESTDKNRVWIQLALFPALFYIGAKLSLAFAIMPESIVLLWIPNSILLAGLLHYHARHYVYFAALIIVAEIAADYPTFSLIEAVLFGAINLFEATLAYILLRRWHFDSRFATPNEIVKFVLAGPVISAFLTGTLAASVYSYFRGMETTYFEFLRIWWFGDGLGLLIFTPLILSFWPAMRNTSDERPELRWYDGLAILGGVGVVLAFLQSHQGIFYGFPIRTSLLLPLVVYVAARFGWRTTTVVVAAVTVLVLYATKIGQQPFGPLGPRQTAIALQEFIVSMSVISLGLAALLSQLRAKTRELEVRVLERTAELSTANTELQKLAVTDSLTGLPNRRALFNLMRREMNREQRHRRKLAVIMFDIDRFKDVNDRCGHAAGDAVLRQVATIACKEIRHVDTMARYGGEEFVLVAPETDEASARQLAERMREALRSTDIVLDHQVIRVTASFGVATLRPEDKEPEQILHRADEALYAAKAGGRDRVVAEVSEPVSASSGRQTSKVAQTTTTAIPK